jgi:Putative DNA-binding domain
VSQNWYLATNPKDSGCFLVNLPRITVAELLSSNDPLSDTACIGLLSYKEEDSFVDFKQSFDLRHDKSWIDLAVDCVAFANTDGGYVVFGVADKTWKLVGLQADSIAALSDSKKVLEKINRNLVPVLTRVRTREIEHDGLRFVVLYSPSSPDFTHIFESNLDWSPTPGKPLVLVSKGAIYTRRVASNQLLTSVDFELLIERRLKRFRDKMLEGVARVIQAPIDHEVVTIVHSRDAAGAATVTIGDAPESLDLRGKPLRLARDSITETIKVLEALSNADERINIPEKILFEAYGSREKMNADDSMVGWLALHSLLSHAPAFFWLGRMKPADVRKLLKRAFDRATWRRGYILTYSGFYGKTIYNEFRDKMISAGHRAVPSFREKPQLLNVDASRSVERDAKRATELAQSLVNVLDQTAIHELERLDCSLYAPFD